ncbi:MAG: hypothetical protein M3Q46_07715 [Verrucomicrobiota bacterium]|nr:hypothetical protein [Verrucomicrobiota bacterium]
MRQPLLLALLAVATIFYFYNSPASGPSPASAPAAVAPTTHAAAAAVSPPAPIIAAASAYSERWKTGPNAQTDLKMGPNAQTDFAPFAPSEHATWNQTSGYTLVAGPQMPRR